VKRCRSGNTRTDGESLSEVLWRRESRPTDMPSATSPRTTPLRQAASKRRACFSALSIRPRASDLITTSARAPMPMTACAKPRRFNPRATLRELNNRIWLVPRFASSCLIAFASSLECILVRYARVPSAWQEYGSREPSSDPPAGIVSHSYFGHSKRSISLSRAPPHQQRTSSIRWSPCQRLPGETT